MIQMATLKRGQNSGIWFKHIDDPGDELIPHLRALTADQSVVLRLGQSTGVWVRFTTGSDGRLPEGLKCGDEKSKQIWNEIPTDGSSVEIALVQVLTQPKSPRTESTRGSPTKVSLEPLSTKTEASVLCLGVDVAWWGGQKGEGSVKQSTRTETIAYLFREDGEWSHLSLKRVDLNDAYNPTADPKTPNADADASTLTAGIKEVLDAHSRIANVVLALDVPILAKDEGTPNKTNERDGEGGLYRKCDEAWMKEREKSPKGWRTVNILPGAPIVPRVRALINNLRKLDFEVYGRPPMDQQRIVFECFPNEVAWSAGILGFAEGLTIDTLQLYKRLGKKRTPLPEDLFCGVWKHSIDTALNTGGVDEDCRSRWLEDFRRWLIEDGVFNEVTRIGQTGKQFDDAVDSVLSLSAAVAYVMGNAHIHQGIDPDDGHIIGPGNTTRRTLPADP
jgi:hypothetical protein